MEFQQIRTHNSLLNTRMTNGFGFAPATAQASQLPASLGKKSLEADALLAQLRSQLSACTSRLKLVEERIDTLRNHIDMIDKSLIDKHKALTEELKTDDDQMRAIRTDINMLKDMTDRLAKRLEAFASREEVKVLQRYVDMLQPLNYVTRQELETQVRKLLAEAGLAPKE